MQPSRPPGFPEVMKTHEPLKTVLFHLMKTHEPLKTVLLPLVKTHTP